MKTITTLLLLACVAAAQSKAATKPTPAYKPIPIHFDNGSIDP